MGVEKEGAMEVHSGVVVGEEEEDALEFSNDEEVPFVALLLLLSLE